MLNFIIILVCKLLIRLHLNTPVNEAVFCMLRMCDSLLVAELVSDFTQFHMSP